MSAATKIIVGMLKDDMKNDNIKSILRFVGKEGVQIQTSRKEEQTRINK